MSLNGFLSNFSFKKVDALVIEKPVDLLYLTGLDLSLGTLVISAKGARLFVDGRYLAFAKKKSGVPCEKTTSKAISKCLHSFSKVGFDSTNTTYARWQELSTMHKKWVPLPQPTSMARSIKSAAEIKILKKSAMLAWKGFQFLKQNLKAGMTEKEAVSLLEVYCLKNGADGMAFEPIIAFGKNTAFPHHRSSFARLKKGDCVLLDLGVVLDHYHSDMTRTFFFGKPDPRLVALEKAVKAAHDAALHLCRPGVKVGALDSAACQVIKKAGLAPYLAHSLGHGVGLEIHEFPRLKNGGEDTDVLLKEGMVITIEPGLYWPGVGGYRYEDTIVIKREGYENWYP